MGVIPSSISVAQIVYYVSYVVLMIAAGLGEFWHLAPNGTFIITFTLVSGHFLGSTPAANALNANTVATLQNTAATAASSASPSNGPALPGSPTSPQG